MPIDNNVKTNALRVFSLLAVAAVGLTTSNCSGDASGGKDAATGGTIGTGGRSVASGGALGQTGGGGGNGGIAGAAGGAAGGSLATGGDDGSSGGGSGTGGLSRTGGATVASGGAAMTGGRGGGAGGTPTGGAGASMSGCGMTGGGGASALPVIATAVQYQSGFENGALAPYRVCTTQSPNYVRPASLNGRRCVELFWTEAGYDGTRLDRGAEGCSDLNFTKEGWYGFQFYLPSPGFPTDKNQGIAQIFATGGCSSWAAMLQVRGNDLWLDHRGNCASPPQYSTRLATNIPRNKWNSIIIHFTVSHLQAGGLEVWFGDATCAPGAEPTYAKKAVNFAFGAWTGDELSTAVIPNAVGLKFGMYNFDSGNYTAGETRVIYYDNITQLVGNPSDAWGRVNPNNR